MVLSFTLSLWKPLAIVHATLRTHRSCFKLSSSDPSSKFRSIRGTPSWRSERWITPVDGPLLSRILTKRDVTFQNCTLPFSHEAFVPFRKIDLDFGGHYILQHTTQRPSAKIVPNSKPLSVFGCTFTCPCIHFHCAWLLNTRKLAPDWHRQAQILDEHRRRTNRNVREEVRVWVVVWACVRAMCLLLWM